MTDPENPKPASEDPEPEQARDETMKSEEKGEGEATKVAGVTMPQMQMPQMSDIQLPFVGMFFSGMVVLIAINSGPGKSYNYWEYGNALGAVTMFFSLVGGLMTLKNEGVVQKVGKFNAYFLFLWCFIGACIMTFGQGPFISTGNGYFASWGMAIFSVQAAGVSSEALKGGITGMSSMIGLLTSSVVVLVATASLVGKNIPNRNEGIYALVLSGVTILVIALFLFLERGEDAQPSKLKFPILAVFAIMWITEACLVTFRGPFINTGNGYFGSWGGALTSMFATLAARS